MDINTIRIAVTLASFVIFIGIIVWALRPANAARFQAAAQAPFNEDDAPNQDGTSVEGRR